MANCPESVPVKNENRLMFVKERAYMDNYKIKWDVFRDCSALVLFIPSLKVSSIFTFMI